MSRTPFSLLALAAAAALTGLILLAISFLMPTSFAWLDSMSKGQMIVLRTCSILLPILALGVVAWRRRRQHDDDSEI
jgi:hypothetical protein